MHLLKDEIKNKYNTAIRGDRKLLIISVMFSLYISTVICFSFLDELQYYLIAFMLFAILSWVFLIELMQHSFNLSVNQNGKQRLKKVYVMSSLFLIILVGAVCYWLAYYPGGFNLDALGQWEQAHGDAPLNNWHPIFTTLIYKFLISIYDSFAFCIGVQIVIFSLSTSFLLYELYNIGIKYRYLIMSAIYIAISPAINKNNICMYKDVYYTITVIWLLVLFIKICISNGQWLKKNVNIISLCVLFILSALIRHNAIFLISTSIVTLFIVYKESRKRLVILAGVTILVLVVIEGPLLRLFNVRQHDNVVGESVGVPMAIMVNAYIFDEEYVPDEVRQFVEDIAPREAWERCYLTGEWDSCKWEFGGTKLFKNESITHFVQLCLKTIIACPDASYMSFRENTRVVWMPVGNIYWDTWVYIEDNEYGIENARVYKVGVITDKIEKVIYTLSGAVFFWNIGAIMIIYGFLLLLAFRNKHYEVSAIIMPMVVYNLLTMLMLCGPSHRYFYFNSVVILPVILFVLSRPKLD